MSISDFAEFQAPLWHDPNPDIKMSPVSLNG